jgi:hypothetical protein
MDYVITIYKRPGVQPNAHEPLYALWIDMLDAEPQPGTIWQVVQTVEVSTKEPIPAALCGELLMSEATSDRLFRQIADTWLGPVEDDPLNDYDRYASQEEAREDYLDDPAESLLDFLQ